MMVCIGGPVPLHDEKHQHHPQYIRQKQVEDLHPDRRQQQHVDAARHQLRSTSADTPSRPAYRRALPGVPACGNRRCHRHERRPRSPAADGRRAGAAGYGPCSSSPGARPRRRTWPGTAYRPSAATAPLMLTINSTGSASRTINGRAAPSFRGCRAANHPASAIPPAVSGCSPGGARDKRPGRSSVLVDIAKQYQSRPEQRFDQDEAPPTAARTCAPCAARERRQAQTAAPRRTSALAAGDAVCELDDRLEARRARNHVPVAQRPVAPASSPRPARPHISPPEHDENIPGQHSHHANRPITHLPTVARVGASFDCRAHLEARSPAPYEPAPHRQPDRGP